MFFLRLSVIGNRAHFRGNAQAKRCEYQWAKLGRFRLRNSSHHRALPERAHQIELPSRLHTGVLLKEPGNVQVFLSLAKATASSLRREYSATGSPKGTLRRRSMGGSPQLVSRLAAGPMLMTLSFVFARWRRRVSRGWHPGCLTMFSTSSVNVIGFDPNRQPWPLDGCADIWLR